MKKIYYNKLIRDRIPEKILKKGSRLKTRKLGPKEFEEELRKKVAEEAGGIVAARSKVELLDELADLRVVIDELKRFKKINSRETGASYQKNVRTKGGLKKRVFLIWSSDDDYRSNEKKGKR